MQRVIPDIGDDFRPVKTALWDMFILDLFQDVGEGTLGRGVTRLPVKQAGLALPYPTKTAPENWMASCVIIGNIVVALRGQEEYRTVDHAAYIREGRPEVRNSNKLRSEEALVETLEGATARDARRLRRVTKTGKWIKVKPSTVNGTELGA